MVYSKTKDGGLAELILTCHQIFKFIRAHGSVDYTCETCRTSYLTVKSLREDHPNLKDSMIIIKDKRFTELEASLNQSFTELFMELARKSKCPKCNKSLQSDSVFLLHCESAHPEVCW